MNMISNDDASQGNGKNPHHAPQRRELDAAGSEHESTAGAAAVPRVIVNDSEESSDGSRRDSASVTYRDFSRDRPEPTSHKESAQTFPMKLHTILSNPEFNDVIAFLPHGRAWRILQHKAFEERVIPLYFRHGRYSSFARQVNGWGFRRITHGPDYNSYYHELFLRGLPHLCQKMKRLTSSDIKKAQQEEVPLPDFYALSRDFPLPENPSGGSSPKPSQVPPTSSVAAVSIGAPAAAAAAPKAGTLEASETAPSATGAAAAAVAGAMLGRWQQMTPSQPPAPAAPTPSTASIPGLPGVATLQGNNGAPGASNLHTSMLDRRADIMQRLISLSSGGVNGAGTGAGGGQMSGQTAQALSQPQPTASVAQSAPAVGGINSGLLSLLQQQGLPPNLLVGLTQSLNPSATPVSSVPEQAPSSAAAWPKQLAVQLAPAPTPASSAGMPAPAQALGGIDIASLLRRQQQQHHAAPMGAQPASAVTPQQQPLDMNIGQLLSDPNAATILQLQMQLAGSRAQLSAMAPNAPAAPVPPQPQAAAAPAPSNQAATASLLQALAAAAAGANGGGTSGSKNTGSNGSGSAPAPTQQQPSAPSAAVPSLTAAGLAAPNWASLIGNNPALAAAMGAAGAPTALATQQQAPTAAAAAAAMVSQQQQLQQQQNQQGAMFDATSLQRQILQAQLAAAAAAAAGGNGNGGAINISAAAPTSAQQLMMGAAAAAAAASNGGGNGSGAPATSNMGQTGVGNSTSNGSNSANCATAAASSSAGSNTQQQQQQQQQEQMKAAAAALGLTLGGILDQQQ